MMRSLTLLAAGLVAVHAQADLPQCGQLCVQNMLQKAITQFGCNANNLASCACCKADFGFGIRDCSEEVCGDGTPDYSSVISYGSSYCASAATSCPGSSIPATSVIATATDAANATMSSSVAVITSGPLVNSSMTMPSGADLGLVAAASDVSTISGSPNAYVVDGDNTISVGGNTYGNDGTTYSALPSGQGVLVMANGASIIANPASATAATTSTDSTATAATTTTDSDGGVLIIDPIGTVVATTSSSDSAGSTGGSGGGAANQSGGSGASSSSSSSDNFAPIQTAAPALVGGLAMAVLAF